MAASASSAPHIGANAERGQQADAGPDWKSTWAEQINALLPVAQGGAPDQEQELTPVQKLLNELQENLLSPQADLDRARAILNSLRGGVEKPRDGTDLPHVRAAQIPTSDLNRIIEIVAVKNVWQRAGLEDRIYLPGGDSAITLWPGHKAIPEKDRKKALKIQQAEQGRIESAASTPASASGSASASSGGAQEPAAVDDAHLTVRTPDYLTADPRRIGDAVNVAHNMEKPLHDSIASAVAGKVANYPQKLLTVIVYVGSSEHATIAREEGGLEKLIGAAIAKKLDPRDRKSFEKAIIVFDRGEPLDVGLEHIPFPQGPQQGAAAAAAAPPAAAKPDVARDLS